MTKDPNHPHDAKSEADPAKVAEDLGYASLELSGAQSPPAEVGSVGNWDAATRRKDLIGDLKPSQELPQRPAPVTKANEIVQSATTPTSPYLKPQTVTSTQAGITSQYNG